MKKKSKQLAKQEFTPTETMKRWLASSFELGYGAKITEVAEHSKVSRMSWYLWIENEEFVKWFDGMWQKFLMSNRWKLDAIGLKQAEKDYGYWKDMMVRVGNLQPSTTTGGIQQQFNQFNLTDAQIKRIIED